MLKKIAVAAAALAFAAPALADGWHGDRGRHYGHYRPHPHFAHYRPVYVAPPRVFYAPRVVYAPPVYYYGAPVYYGPPRIGISASPAPGVSFSLDLPL